MAKFLVAALTMGVPFGAIMGIFWWLTGETAAMAAILGAIGGALFGVFMAAYVTWHTARMRAQFEGKYAAEAGEQVLREGPANHFERVAIGGYLFLTSRKLHFIPHRSMQAKAREVAVPLADIVAAEPYRSLGLISNGLRVRTKSGEERFVVEGNAAWAEAIAKTRAA